MNEQSYNDTIYMSYACTCTSYKNDKQQQIVENPRGQSLFILADLGQRFTYSEIVHQPSQ